MAGYAIPNFFIEGLREKDALRRQEEARVLQIEEMLSRDRLAQEQMGLQRELADRQAAEAQRSRDFQAEMGLREQDERERRANQELKAQLLGPLFERKIETVDPNTPGAVSLGGMNLAPTSPETRAAYTSSIAKAEMDAAKARRAEYAKSFPASISAEDRAMYVNLGDTWLSVIASKAKNPDDLKEIVSRLVWGAVQNGDFKSTDEALAKVDAITNQFIPFFKRMKEMEDPFGVANTVSMGTRRGQIIADENEEQQALQVAEMVRSAVLNNASPAKRETYQQNPNTWKSEVEIALSNALNDTAIRDKLGISADRWPIVLGRARNSLKTGSPMLGEIQKALFGMSQ